METSTLLAPIKLALRINHSLLDADITNTIKEAKAEIQRAGVKAEAIVDSDDLIARAIKTYALYIYAADMQTADGYLKSFQYQLDNLRKSSGYN